LTSLWADHLQGGIMVFGVGSQAFIIESNRTIREVTIVKRSGDFYIVRFGNAGGIQVRSCRLFATAEDAEATLPKRETIQKRTGYRSPYDYLH